jgi:hypothetical protein
MSDAGMINDHTSTPRGGSRHGIGARAWFETVDPTRVIAD